MEKTIEKSELPLEQWFARIINVHGDCFLLLKIEDGKISLLGAASSLETLNFSLETKRAGEYFG